MNEFSAELLESYRVDNVHIDDEKSHSNTWLESLFWLIIYGTKQKKVGAGIE